MKRAHHRWYSPSLGREMDLLVLGHGGARVVVFPTRCGRFFDYEDFGLAAAIADRLENGWLQLYCVDSVDQEGLYADWIRREDRIRRHQSYERYILEEVLPFADGLNHGTFLITHGCSMGAYHAVNIALRHPHRFNKVVALSGRYDLTVSVGDFRDLFDGHHDQDIYFQMPTQYLANLEDAACLDALRRLEVVLVCGEQDSFLGSNRQLAGLLAAKGIPHQLHVWNERAHSPKHWARMIRLYL